MNVSEHFAVETITSLCNSHLMGLTTAICTGCRYRGTEIPSCRDAICFVVIPTPFLALSGTDTWGLRVCVCVCVHTLLDDFKSLPGILRFDFPRWLRIGKCFAFLWISVCVGIPNGEESALGGYAPCVPYLWCLVLR